ncbi:WD40/YVTN/BNR-like repeat-containing protein [Clostridium lundense]|uniref:WD40/YVTN/BNR-like repeat-containing protein n=1 Tax=Clostridium lundense TaxID=319475 RepID=UPI000484BD4C|nr:hypothetical protein [Clostridium lundense]
MKKYLWILLIISLISFGTACGMAEENKIKSKEKEIDEYNILDFYMVDRGNGWAIAKEGVLTTVNKGKTWNNTNIKDEFLKSILASTTNGKNNRDKAYKFLDKNIAFIAYRKENNINIYKTIDRGKSWDKSVLGLKNFGKEKDYSIYIKVIDKDNVFVMLAAAKDKNSIENSLYKTIDGGKSWSNIYNDNIPMEMESSSLLSSEKKIVTGVEFKNKNLGWYTTKASNTYPIVYKTKDGGVSWNLQKLQIPKGYENIKGALLSTYPPVFTKSGKKVYLPVELNNGKSSIIIFYKSINEGESWIPTIPIEMKPFIEIDYGIDGDGIIWIKDNSGNKIYRLQNDDKDLQEIRSDIELKNKKIQFVNKNNGFMLIDNKIYTTKDKGITWKILR